VLVRPLIEPRPPAQQTDAQPTEPTGLVAQLDSLIDVNIDPKDISVSHSIPSKNRRNGPPSIIISFIKQEKN
jgi:hypothetical protein